MHWYNDFVYKYLNLKKSITIDTLSETAEHAQIFFYLLRSLDPAIIINLAI